jgi:hypothetical protein
LGGNTNISTYILLLTYLPIALFFIFHFFSSPKQAIFSSVIVFDTPQWEYVEKGQQIGDDHNDHNDHSDEEEEKEQVKQSTRSTSFLAHYGGSERTVDGMVRTTTTTTKTKKKIKQSLGHSSDNDDTTNTPFKTTGPTRIIPIITKESIHPITTTANTTTTKTTSLHNNNNKKKKNILMSSLTTTTPTNHRPSISLNDEHDSDTSFQLLLTHSITSSSSNKNKTRQVPQRQASLKRKRYTVDEDDDEVIEVISPPSKGSQNQQPTSTNGIAAPTIPFVATSKTTTKPTITTKQRTAMTNHSAINLLDSSSDSGISSTNNDDNDDDDDEEEDYDPNPSAYPKIRSRSQLQPPSQKGTTRRKTNTITKKGKQSVMKIESAHNYNNNNKNNQRGY